MEKLTYEGTNQRKIESFLLVNYTVYLIILIAMSIGLKWASWVGVVISLGLASIWIVYIAKPKNYIFRAKYTAIVVQAAVVLYAINVADFSRAMPVFIVSVVTLGLYGVADIIGMTFLAATFIFFYHGMIEKTVDVSEISQFINVTLQICNVYFLEYIVYLWTKRNSEGSKQLLKVIDELKEVESSKDDFLANISHEIRTPINTICGMSELVLKEELPYKIKDEVLNIQIAGRNLMSVVSDILDFSELQSGKIELEEEAYNITSTINDVINMALARKNDKKIELIVDCDANIPSVLLGDEKKLRRVIMNLVDNAIKFTEEGCVSIIVGYRKEAYGINLSVTVKDTGIGMEEASIEKLFSSFSQVDTSRNRHEGGVGLGLAISQTLVQKMGGAITIKSKLGKGSIVKFVVPQKVLEDTPIVSIQNRDQLKVATYIDMEQFNMVAIRDEYSSMIINMVEQLRAKCHVCRNLAELQRREETEHFTHIFTSVVEYRENKAYFDKLAERTNVIVVLDRFDEKYVTNPQLLKIYKPFYILTVVSVINGLNDEQAGRHSAHTEKFETRNAHVLVVDDNRMNLRVIEGLLENYKIEVTMATSGQEALEKIKSADYDFVFMDHMMPEMDGVETLHRIRHKVGTYYQKVPIIALTANAVAGTREMMLQEGFTDFLEKPIERSVLERVLKRNLPAEKIIYKAEQLNNDSDVEIERNVVEKTVAKEVMETALKDTVQQEIVQAEPEQEEEQGIAAWMKELTQEGLEIEKGILYCNGEEPYIKVLRGYCEDSEDSGLQVEQLFAKEDWKNYTIAVHGMKSAMRSIGALEISELARKLEFAGKEERLDYIMEHHQELVDAYRNLFERLQAKKWLCPDKEKEERQGTVCDSDLLVLEIDEFEQLLTAMEDAMYDLDGDRLLEILAELENYQYFGVALRDICAQARRKVEKCDYVSAVEMVMRWKNGLVNKENL